MSVTFFFFLKKRHSLSFLSHTCELNQRFAGFNVPEGTRHVATGCHNLAVVEEAAARQVARVPGQLPRKFYLMKNGREAKIRKKKNAIEMNGQKKNQTN